MLFQLNMDRVTEGAARTASMCCEYRKYVMSIFLACPRPSIVTSLGYEKFLVLNPTPGSMFPFVK